MTSPDLQEMTSEHGEFLTFEMGGKKFGLDVLSVQEIRQLEQINPLPQVPEYIKGVIDLRGEIVPIIDLRIRFNVGNADYSDKTVIIVLKNEDFSIGVIVDAVSDVIEIHDQDLQFKPDLGSEIDIAYIKHIANVADQLILLLDTQKLLNAEELYVIQKNIQG